MSAHGHAAAESHAAGHDPHGHEHVYEGIPADRLGEGEPATPIWLPLVGISLVLGTILAYIVTRPEPQTREQLAPAAAAAPATAQADQPAQPERRAPRALPSGFRPGALGSALARPGAPGPFAVPGGSAAPARRRPPPGAVPAHGEPGHPPH